MTKEIIKIDDISLKVSELTKFEITKEELIKKVAETKDITVYNLEDKNQIARAKRARIDLRDIEIEIEKTGKSYRDVFTKVNKDIMEKQKELLAITTPEVDRLKEFEDKAKEVEIRKEREMLLPFRREELLKVNNTTEDSVLLDMDNSQFSEYLSSKTEEKNEKERQLVIEKEREEQKQKDIKEAEERARKEAEKRAEVERIEAKKKADAEIERLKNEAKAKEEAEERARLEKIAEEKKLAKRKEFVEWRASLGYSEETKSDYRQEEIDGEIVLFKKVGAFKK